MSKLLLKSILSLALISSCVGVTFASGGVAPGQDPEPPVARPK